MFGPRAVAIGREPIVTFSVNAPLNSHRPIHQPARRREAPAPTSTWGCPASCPASRLHAFEAGDLQFTHLKLTTEAQKPTKRVQHDAEALLCGCLRHTHAAVILRAGSCES
jgi:hypothetical protein